MNRISLQQDSRPWGGYTSSALSAKWASFCDALPTAYPIRANFGNGHSNNPKGRVSRVFPWVSTHIARTAAMPVA